MNIATPRSAPAGLAVIVTLARVLERLENSAVAVDAEQYRGVVRRLADALQQASGAVPLQAVLDAFPATAALYENLHYEHAGLCRTPLEQSLDSERLARGFIAAARRREQSGPVA